MRKPIAIFVFLVAHTLLSYCSVVVNGFFVDVCRRWNSAVGRKSSALLSSPQSPQSSLDRAIEDAAANFTQGSCQILGLKSVGVDYGLVRTGIAVTVGYNPKPLETIVVKPELQERLEEEKAEKDRRKIDDKNSNRNATYLGNKTYVSEQVVNIARREQADQIIVGLPLHSNGTEAEQTNITRIFAAELALHVLKGLGPDVPVYLWDERYTSKEAAARAHSRDPHRYLYGTLDAESASIILEHYYNSNGEGAERVNLIDEAIVKEYTLKWEETKRQEEQRLRLEQEQRNERLRWRKEAMERDRMMESEYDASTEGSNQKKKKKRKKKK